MTTEVHIAQTDLRDALGLLSPVASATRLIARTGGLTLDLGPDGGSLMVLTPDVDMRVTLPHAVAATPRRARFPLNPMHGFVQKLEADTVSLEISEDADAPMVVRAGSAEARISLQAAKDGMAGEWGHPEPDAGAVTLPSADLAAVLSVAYASAAADYQAVLRYVLLDVRADTLRAVATDGFRLALRTVSIPPTTPRRFLLPTATVRSILKLLQRGPTVTLWWPNPAAPADKALEARLLLRVGDVTIVVTGGEGSFPDYERVLPQSSEITFEVSRAAFLGALGRVMILSDRTVNSRVDLVLGEHVGDLVLRTTSPNGSSEDRLPIDRSEEVGVNTVPEHMLAFNGRYLTDALGGVTGDRVRFACNTGQSAPVMLTDASADRAARDNFAMLVPLRLG